MSSQSGVQQGDPLGPMLFVLVLKNSCLAWYFDDGVLAGNRSDVVRVVHLYEELGPHLGLHINISKCKLFSRVGNSFSPSVVKFSFYPTSKSLGYQSGAFCFVHNRLQRNAHFHKLYLKY